MKKILKKERLEIILEVLRNSSVPLSATDIHDQITKKEMGMISRKTIARDLKEMLLKGTLRSSGHHSHLYVMSGTQNHFHLELSNEEATYLIVVLPGEHPVNLRLKKMMGI
jgi:Fe2+ or Zn2+ uptake regulation protein